MSIWRPQRHGDSGLIEGAGPDEQLAYLERERDQKPVGVALAAAAFALLIAFLVSGIVLYSARDLAGRLRDYQLNSCVRGNDTRAQIRLGQTVLDDLITSVLPGLQRGPVKEQFESAQTRLKAGISTLDPINCQREVPR